MKHVPLLDNNEQKFINLTELINESGFKTVETQIEQEDWDQIKAILPDLEAGHLSPPKLIIARRNPSSSSDTDMLVAVDESMLLRELRDKQKHLKHVTQELKQREQRLRAILDAEPECVKLLDKNGMLIDMNPAGLTMIEADSIDEVKNHCVYPLISEQHRSKFRDLTERVFKGESGVMEFQIIGLKGSKLWLETHANPLRDEEGNVCALLGVTRDITEQKHTSLVIEQTQVQLRTALQAAESSKHELSMRNQVLSALADSATDLMKHPNWRGGISSMLARLGKATNVSRVYLFELNKTPNEAIRVSQRAEWSADGIEGQIDNADLQNIDMAASGFEHWTSEMEAGRPVIACVNDMPVSERPLLESQGILSLAAFPIMVDERWWGFIGFDDCETERIWSDAEIDALRTATGILSAAIKRSIASGTLLESETKFAAAFQISPYPMRITRMDGVHVEVNDAYCKLVGYQPHEMLGKTSLELDLIDPDYRENLVAEIKNKANKIENLELQIRVRDGSDRNIIMSVDSIMLEGVPHRISTCVDVTKRKIAEEALTESERRFRNIVETATEGIWTLGPDGRTDFVNKQMASMLGVEPKDMIGKEISVFMDESSRIEALKLIERRRQGISEQHDLKLKHANGQDVWTSINTNPLLDEHGEFAGALAMVTDITAQKQDKDALRTNQQHLTALINTVEGIVWEADAKTFQFTFVSPRAERLLGYPIASWLDDPHFWADHIHPDDRAKAVQYCTESTKKMLDYEFEYRMMAADGSVVWLRDLVSIVIENGEAVSLRGLMVDITQRIKDTNQINHLNRVYSVLSDINQTIVRERDPQIIIDEACRIAVEKGDFRLAWIGFTDDQPDSLRIAAHSGASTETITIIEQLLSQPNLGCVFTKSALEQNRRSVCYDIETDERTTPWRQAALERGYRSLISLPLSIEGRCIGNLNLYAEQVDFFDDKECRLLDELANDISFALDSCQRDKERRIAVEQLKVSERRFRELAETIDEVFWIADPKVDRLLYISPAYARVWGRSCESLYEKPLSWRDGIHPDDRERVLEAIRRRPIENHYDLEFRIIRPNGDLRWVRDWAILVYNDNGDIEREVGVARDITKQKDAEEALQKREEYYRLLIENASDLITVINFKGEIKYQSPSIQRVLGIPHVDIIGKNLIDLIHVDDKPSTWDAIQRIIADPTTQVPFEYRAKHLDGSWHLIQTMGRNIVGQSEEGFIVVNSRDITENRQLERQFRQAQKMEAIGQLAGGVAHDFNNILAAIMMQAELASMDSDVEKKTQSGLQEIIKYAERAADLTRQLLLFSRRQVMQQRTLDLNELVTSLMKMLQRIIGEDIRLQLHLHPATLMVHADSGMLDQILMNLAINARDAMFNGGRLIIETGSLILQKAISHHEGAVAAGEYHWFSVSDNGAGIPPEVLPHIFEPFFTTKEPGKGTGLGLATVFGIVKQHNGWIDVTNQTGGGTAITVYLPINAANPGPLKSTLLTSKPKGGSETILLVEDAPAVRKLSNEILQRNGYQVLNACDGEEALEIWRTQRDKISLLFTDMVMPGGITGQKLARLLKADDPHLKVVYSSGYSRENAGKDLELRPGENFVQKPYHPDQLLATIRHCLDE